jgi:hypothetical protein
MGLGQIIRIDRRTPLFSGECSPKSSAVFWWGKWLESLGHDYATAFIADLARLANPELMPETTVLVRALLTNKDVRLEGTFAIFTNTSPTEKLT